MIEVDEYVLVWVVAASRDAGLPVQIREEIKRAWAGLSADAQQQIKGLLVAAKTSRERLHYSLMRAADDPLLAWIEEQG